MSSYNYEFDFYTWEKDIQCADLISKNMTETTLKNAIQIAIANEIYKNDSPSLTSNNPIDFTAIKDAIQLAIHKNDYVDDESTSSNNTNDFNEIHDDNDVNYNNKKKIIKYKIKIKMKIKNENKNKNENENENENKYCAWVKCCFSKK